MFFLGNTCAVVYFYLTVFVLVVARSETVPFEHLSFFRTLVGAHACIVATGFFCWLYIESHDPSLPSWFGDLLPTTKKWTASKYVSEHRKPIEGLDHFCSWLNVAIARSNYVPFFVLTCCGVLQYALQAIIGGLMLTLWHPELEAKTSSPDDPDALVGHAAAVVLVLGSLGMGFPFAMLLLFHGTLLRTGETTYTYIQNAQKKEMKARKERQARQQAVRDEAGDTAGEGLSLTDAGPNKASAAKEADEDLDQKDDQSRFGDPPRSVSPPPGALAGVGRDSAARLVFDQP